MKKRFWTLCITVAMAGAAMLVMNAFAAEGGDGKANLADMIKNKQKPAKQQDQPAPKQQPQPQSSPKQSQNKDIKSALQQPSQKTPQQNTQQPPQNTQQQTSKNTQQTQKAPQRGYDPKAGGMSGDDR